MLSQRTRFPSSDHAAQLADSGIVRDAWHDLRSAIAEEFIEKLPPVISIHDLEILFGATRAEILAMMRSGQITAVSARGTSAASLTFRPRDNRGLFMRELLIRLTPSTAMVRVEVGAGLP